MPRGSQCSSSSKPNNGVVWGEGRGIARPAPVAPAVVGVASGRASALAWKVATTKMESSLAATPQCHPLPSRRCLVLSS